jgi:hypothetical protein
MTLLATMCSLLALIFYLRYATSGRIRWLPPVIFLYAAAILSKPTFIGLPVVFLILDVWPLGRGGRRSGRSAWRPIIEKAPLLVLMIACAALHLRLHSLTEPASPPGVGGLELVARNVSSLAARTVWPANLTPFRPLVGGPEKGVRTLLPERPGGCFAQKGPDPFSAAQCKLVVFVPAAEVDALADAVFEAGAGRIGEYQKCSYRLRGQGTFFGTEATDPTIGRKGRLERVEEIRLEVIFPKRRLAAVTAAVRRAHSYDQPAFDIYPLEPLPEGRIGQGRIGGFDRAVTLATLARRLAKQTAAANVLTVGKRGGKLTRGLVCVGAAGALPFEIAGRPCGPGDVVITGEIRHHDALRYDRCGVAAVALGHWASERPVLAPLAAMLRKLLPGLTATISRADRDPFRSP